MSGLEDERRAIAQELHDGPIQHLTAATLRLHSALGLGAISIEVAEKVAADLEEAAAQLRGLMASLLGQPGGY